jgi:hypothetical protein
VLFFFGGGWGIRRRIFETQLALDLIEPFRGVRAGVVPYPQRVVCSRPMGS